MSKALALLALTVLSSVYAAEVPQPSWTNHNRIAGSQQMMTNFRPWAEAVGSTIGDKRDKDDLAVYETVFGEWKITGTWLDPNRDKKPYRVEPLDDVVWSLLNADGGLLDQKPISSDGARIEFSSNVTATRAYEFRPSSDRLATTNDVNEAIASATNDSSIVRAPINENGQRVFAEPLFVPPGTDDFNINATTYFYDPVSIYNISFLRDSNGNDVLNTLANKADRATTLSGYGITDAAPLSMISETNPTFSNAVLAVQISTNDFAALYELKNAFAELPIDPVTGGISIGSLLAALASAVVWLKKNKVQTLKLEGNSVEASADGGVAKLDAFFTESNSLLTGTIDAEVISKGTAPDAHLEAPTDEHLKLIRADNSVAYDSAKALPYKLTSVIGDRVIATMTLTAASTDITLPTIAANDTTVKDFILDVTNAYAVEGVATDAGINIPRTDFKLVTRDGESLTAVTTVKAGKSAFICFTQKSPVVVDGTTYPCWCVIQLPFGDPS